MKKQQESLKNMVYQAILNGIFTDEYKPNQIINEQELVQKFGCSKTPIREALVTLCNEESSAASRASATRLSSVSREEAQNILDFRLVLEGGYLRQSIGHITEENLAELAEIDERCKQSTDSVWDHWEANTAFHLKLISFSGNAYAYQELERTMNVLKRAYAQFYWQTWSNVNPALDIAHHNDIMQSIREKDLEKTQNYLKEDLADFCG
ncbi:MAG: GntR family transcriptional regulator [Fusicatenibacter saccharivorans]